MLEIRNWKILLSKINLCKSDVIIGDCAHRVRIIQLSGEAGRACSLCDTDSVIYRSSPGDLHPDLSDAMGSMTDELDGCYITEFTSNGAKTYGYKTSDGEQVLKCKGLHRLSPSPDRCRR